TGEGNHLGPTLSLKGIDNTAYYRLENDKRFYTDFTGTGNSLNMRHPRTIQLIMDSLRYWVTEMHVDGFRFDLAPVLARELYEVDRLSAFFDIIHQDQTLSTVKLIAEPWDVGPGGYQVGNFPIRWAEWNGKYRDSLRHFWRGDPHQVPELASRLAGSSDIYQWSGRSAYASINFIVAHDGYTMRDLVSYEQKHNDANGENNQDGHNDNISRNWGVEGPTDDASIEDRRFRIMKSMMGSLAFSQGVPMLSHGDELGRTQKGNNNAYAQDNEISWVDWNLDARQKEMLGFTRRAFALRQQNPVLRRKHFFDGTEANAANGKDVTWVRPDGQEMTADDWRNGNQRILGMLVSGHATDEADERGRLLRGNTMLLVANASETDIRFTVPRLEDDGVWVELIDSARAERHVIDDGWVFVDAHSLVLLRHGVERRTPDGSTESAAHPIVG
ncbi:MAG: glycogen debranching enzyme GlgX, partial [Gemmatimonadaceae bacterium]